MKFNGFNKQGIEFLDKLSKNNTKVWFETNRHIWEKTILEPNKAFVEDMGETLQILVPTIKAIPKVSGSLFKIYRDVRFSKDKTPLKSKIGFIFWQGLAHRMSSSCFYMQYTKDEYYIASGMRCFKNELLKTYRKYIKNEKNRIILHNILQELKSKGYNLPEPKYKKIPKEFNKDDKYIYLSLYAGLFVYKEYKIDEVFYTVELLDKVFSIYEDMHPLQKWVYEMTLTHKE